MKTILAAARIEAIMQLRQPGFWLAVIALAALVQLETYPSAGNLRRLTHLDSSAYAAFRTFLMAMPLAAVIAGVLSAGRVQAERKLGLEGLLGATPRLSPAASGLGKWLGCTAAFSLFPIGLGAAGLGVRALAFPGGLEAGDFLRAALVMGLAPQAFAVTLGFSLGKLVGERLAGMGLAAYFLASALSSGAHPVTGEIPIYRFMGDLGSLVFVYPGWPYQAERVLAGWHTLGFMAGLSAVGLLLALGAAALRGRRS